MAIRLVVTEVTSVDISIAQVKLAKAMPHVVDPLALVDLPVVHDDGAVALLLAFNQFALVEVATFLLHCCKEGAFLGLHADLLELGAEVLGDELCIVEVFKLMQLRLFGHGLNELAVVDGLLVDAFICDFGLDLWVRLNYFRTDGWDFFHEVLGIVC